MAHAGGKLASTRILGAISRSRSGSDTASPQPLARADSSFFSNSSIACSNAIPHFARELRKLLFGFVRNLNAEVHVL
jgi:hypothetical protein